MAVKKQVSKKEEAKISAEAKKLEGEKTMRLSNVSTRVYSTKLGKFFPGTSKEFPESIAIRLLTNTGEIVKTIDALGDPKVSKEIKDRDDRIKQLEGEVEELKGRKKKAGKE